MTLYFGNRLISCKLNVQQGKGSVQRALHTRLPHFKVTAKGCMRRNSEILSGTVNSEKVCAHLPGTQWEQRLGRQGWCPRLTV